MCVLHFGTSAKQQRGINKFKGLWRTYTRLCIFFPYLNVSTVVIISLKLSFPCDAFVGVSERIQCHFFGREDDGHQRACSLPFYKTAAYCFDDCFASYENIVWISFQRMYRKLLPPLFINLSRNRNSKPISFSKYS